MDATLLSRVSTFYILSAVMLLVPMGRITDIHGRKKIFTRGILIFTIFSLLSGMATSPCMLIVARVLQGIGSSMIFGAGVAIPTSIFPARERGKVLGINMTSVYLGLSLGPFIGDFVTEHGGWRSIFLVMASLGLFVCSDEFRR